MNDLPLSVLSTARIVQRFTEDQSVQSALATCALWNIHGGPVLDSKDKIVGWFDLQDIVNFLAEKIGAQASLDADHAKLQKQLQSFVISDLRTAVHKKYQQPPSRLATDKVSTVATQFHDGAKVAALTDSVGKLQGLATQSDILKFLDQGDLSKALEGKPLPGHTEVRTVHRNIPAWKAFQELSHSKSGCLAITMDDNGTSALVGVLTSADTKGLSKKVQVLFDPIGEYLGNIRRSQDKPASFVVSIVASKDLREALRLMVANHVHQLFIVETEHSKDFKGIVTANDILREALPSSV